MNIKIANEQLERELATYFGIEYSEVGRYYESIKKSFRQNCEKPDSGFINVKKFDKINFKNLETKKNWEQATLAGIDLPILFQNENPDAETIVVIGIDPLRKRSDFQNYSIEDVIIGTPYALHSSFYRERKGRTKTYFGFIEHLYLKGYSVYVTDVFKVWMNDSIKTERDRFFLKQEIETSAELLLKELEIINVKYVIAFGDLVEKYYNDFLKYKSSSIKKFTLPHPSGSNRKWNKLITGSKSCENKIEFLNDAIDHLLDTTSPHLGPSM